jgi:hypothetical protein
MVRFGLKCNWDLNHALDIPIEEKGKNDNIYQIIFKNNLINT